MQRLLLKFLNTKLLNSQTQRQLVIPPPHANASGTLESIFIDYHPLTQTNWQPTFPPIWWDVSAREPEANVGMAAERIRAGNRKLGFQNILDLCSASTEDSIDWKLRVQALLPNRSGSMFFGIWKLVEIVADDTETLKENLWIYQSRLLQKERKFYDWV